MISAADVLLVLGAGASKPYGLPTGPELVERALRIDPRDPNDRFVQRPQPCERICPSSTSSTSSGSSRRRSWIRSSSSSSAAPSSCASASYGAAPDADNCKLAAAGMRVVHEDPGADATVFARVHDLIAGAERIVILGFGYAQSNLERLRLELMSPGCFLYGTTLGMTSSEERANVVRPLEPLLSSRPHKFAGVDSLAFIREQRHLFY